VIAHIDGGARGNPGPAGFGVFMEDNGGRTVVELSEYLGHQTNNVAEYSALIAALEPHPRGWYAGAVGAILPGGDLQLWLTIRTLSVRDGVAVVRTGAGLVAESDPLAEWHECCNKARRTLAALGAEVAAGDC
jgi:hypothetical protein